MGLRDLFKRATDPADWTEMWTVLRPLGGRITPDSLHRMLADAQRLPRDTLVAADEQLGRALILIDTEEHARHLARDAWEAPEKPFGRRRFVRATHAVLAAGPEALARVVADPPALRSYDAGDAASVVERIREQSVVTTLHAAINVGGTGERYYIGPCSEVSSTLADDVGKGWASLADGGMYPFETYDPEGVWLTVTMETPDGEEGWDAESDLATERLLVALGDRTPPQIARTTSLRTAWIDLAVPDEDTEPEGWDLTDEELHTVVHLDAALVAAVPRDQRVDFLTRHAAGALLGSETDLTDEAAATLKALAQ